MKILFGHLRSSTRTCRSMGIKRPISLLNVHGCSRADFNARNEITIRESLTSTKHRGLRDTNKIIYRIKRSDTDIQWRKKEEKVMPRLIVIFNIYAYIDFSLRSRIDAFTVKFRPQNF